MCRRQRACEARSGTLPWPGFLMVKTCSDLRPYAKLSTAFQAMQGPPAPSPLDTRYVLLGGKEEKMDGVMISSLRLYLALGLVCRRLDELSSSDRLLSPSELDALREYTEMILGEHDEVLEGK